MKLILIDKKNNKEYELKDNAFTIGRNKINNIVINDPFVSRKHCQIVKVKDKFYLDDMKTKNGTYLNNKRIKNHVELSNGDEISLYNNGPKFSIKIINNQPEEDLLTQVKIQKQIEKSILKKIIFISALLFFLLIFFFVIVLVIYINSIQKKNKNYNVSKDLTYLMYDKYHEPDFKADTVLIKKIENYVSYYERSGSFKIGLERRKKYIGLIEEIFKKHKIPPDLSFIAFVESNYDPYAYNSYSGARGLWQLMPGTARQYGLIVNRKIDERTDPAKSTEAAARYLSDLIAIFGGASFTLSIAAYNVGDGALRMSLQKLEDPINDRNFWYLYQHNLIPDETKEYVLKVLALMILNEKYKRLENLKR
jgi:pSer/pThr/pTyr-binding forkhead associated (FHA) protein